MTKQLIYEVRQRSPVDITLTRGLGVFTDQSMAQQTVDWCYRGAYITMMDKDFIPTHWFTEGIRDAMKLDGFDRWWPDDMRSPFPLFYIVEHILYGQVPTTDPDFPFSIKP
jgi:hypothetical protein